MNEKPVLDGGALIIVRDELIAHIRDLREKEEEGKLFETLSTILPLFCFFLKLVQKANPYVGFNDTLLAFIFANSNMSMHTCFEFAAFASRPYREKILERCVRLGSLSKTEIMLTLIGRQITEEEIGVLAERNLGAEETYKKVLVLAQKHHPHMMDELTKRKIKYEDVMY